MNSQHHNNTRSSLQLIPLICCFVGINCFSISTADTNADNTVREWAKTPLNMGVADEDRSGLDGYLPGTAYLLEFFIRALSNILEDPTLGTTALEGVDGPLKESADSLILGYPMFGINPELTGSEVQTGLDDAYIILDILKNEPELVNLDEDTKFELAETAEAIIEELEDGE